MHSTEDEIFNAIRSGDQKRLQSLIPHAGDISRFRSDGFSPIHVAIMRKQNGQMIDTLIAAGCDINAQDDNGQTALRLACDMGMQPHIDFLLDRNARIDICDATGSLPRIPTEVLQRRLGLSIPRLTDATRCR